ncbi:MAG TPA: ATP-binding protein [Vicinamibacterales bacterium]
MTRSLVRRLTLGAVAWVGLLGIAVGTIAAWQYWRASLRSIDGRLAEEARTLTSRITVSNNLLEIDLPLDFRGMLTADNRYYGVFDETGRLLDGTAPPMPDGAGLVRDAGATTGPGQEQTRRPTFRTRAGYREVLAAGPRHSVIVIGESLGPAWADVRRLGASLLLASVLGAGLALPVGVWLRRQLARSIAQIDRTARALAPGQPTRIDPRRVDEELAGVAVALNGAFDRLEQALARERQLTSDASHELRTPVTTLVAETQWALSNPRGAEEYRRSLEVCARQGERMKDLVENLLTLARLEAGTLKPARERVSLREIAEDAAAELEGLARQHHVTVGIEGNVTAWADRVQLRVLVSNLLSNAIRYNRPDGAVIVRMGEGEGRIVLRVTDTGVGIPPEAASHVFERFWRADAARSARVGGTGLGLAISKAIADAHAGTIRCESEVDRGTTFIVELPDEGPDTDAEHPDTVSSPSAAERKHAVPPG